MAAATAFADRVCIASNGTIDTQLSTQYLLSCNKNTLGCNGGWVDAAWQFIKEQGLPSAHCVSFLGSDLGCPTTCDNGASLQFTRSGDTIDIHDSSSKSNNVKRIQKEIMTNGPVEATYYVFSDFMYYKNGVYKRSSAANFEGGHAVRVIGWGSEYGKDYWLVANTWGTSWGIDGVFKIIRGTNDCGFENRIAAALPEGI